MSSDDESTVSTKKERTSLRDAREGKTIFVKSLSFDCKKDDLVNFMSEFGELEYCMFCKDEFGHPRGTAFVKFVNKEDADKCLASYRNEPQKFVLVNRKFEVFLAVTKGKAEELSQKRKTKLRDKRNLYLAKEGLIYPDSPAAEGVSQNDLKKRLQLEVAKRAKLGNLNNFVSRNRLCFHNIPENYTDKQLRNLCLKVIDNSKAKITEAKIIRNVNQAGLGKSSGFGFVTFSSHADALQCLRRLNNNPNTFTAHKRPIVEFSIEKLSAVRKKRKNGDFHTEQDHTDFTDIPDEEMDYMGVKAKPFNEDEPIVLPKVNRKMYENMEKLKKRGKSLRQEAKKMKVMKQIKEAKANRQKKLENKQEANEWRKLKMKKMKMQKNGNKKNHY